MEEEHTTNGFPKACVDETRTNCNHMAKYMLHRCHNIAKPKSIVDICFKVRLGTLSLLEQQLSWRYLCRKAWDERPVYPHYYRSMRSSSGTIMCDLHPFIPNLIVLLRDNVELEVWCWHRNNWLSRSCLYSRALSTGEMSGNVRWVPSRKKLSFVCDRYDIASTMLFETDIMCCYEVLDSPSQTLPCIEFEVKSVRHLWRNSYRRSILDYQGNGMWLHAERSQIVLRDFSARPLLAHHFSAELQVETVCGISTCEDDRLVQDTAALVGLRNGLICLWHAQMKCLKTIVAMPAKLSFIYPILKGKCWTLRNYSIINADGVGIPVYGTPYFVVVDCMGNAALLDLRNLRAYGPPTQRGPSRSGLSLSKSKFSSLPFYNIDLANIRKLAIYRSFPPSVNHLSIGSSDQLVCSRADGKVGVWSLWDGGEPWCVHDVLEKTNCLQCPLRHELMNCLPLEDMPSRHSRRYLESRPGLRIPLPQNFSFYFWKRNDGSLTEGCTLTGSQNTQACAYFE